MKRTDSRASRCHSRGPRLCSKIQPQQEGAICGGFRPHNRVPGHRFAIRGDLAFALLLSLIALISPGCAIGPDYKQPAVDAPHDFRFTNSQSTNSFADLPWWEVFKDPTLLDLIQTA